MCGIISIYSKHFSKDIASETISKLKLLEYRGYDSWGFALKTNEEVYLKKQVGMISKASDSFEGLSKISIAHTRWATHGKVNETNAHPHYSEHKKVYLVHNGIIENYYELKEFLKSKGYGFYSETDSEVIANLIEYYLEEGDVLDAVSKALSMLKGSYALAILFKDYDILVGSANESPLIFGASKDKYYLASDARAFVGDVDELVALDDKELVVIDENAQRFYKLDKGLKEISKSFEKADKTKYGFIEPLNGYPYYTLKEITEQKQKLKEVINYSSETIEQLAEDLNNAFGVFFIASGSSYNAALAASYLFSKHAKTHVNVVDASEFAYYKHFITPKTLVIPISQSGETADVIEAVKIAKSKGAKIVAITNTYGSTLMRLADYSVLMHAGTEVSVVATKSYTAQLIILIYLLFATIRLQSVAQQKLPLLYEALSDLMKPDFYSKLETLSEKLKNLEHLYILGRGVNYATALEGALKIKEISYIHTEAFPGGALKHGSIALIDDTSWVIVIAPNDETYEEIISNAMEVKSRGAKVIGIGSTYHEVFDEFIYVPDVDLYQPIINVVPLQYLAYFLAIKRGNNPDKPRNLAKSVTVK